MAIAGGGGASTGVSAPFSFNLKPYPTAAGDMGCTVSVVGRVTPEDLLLEYVLQVPTGVMLQRASASVAPSRCDDLWRHTCCEAFFAIDGGSGYLEFNFSPSGDWAAYDFEGERRGRVNHVWHGREPRVRWFALDRLLVTLPLSTFSSWGAPVILQAAYTAVVETDAGEHSFWALQHARDKPDFHARESFIARLEVP